MKNREFRVSRGKRKETRKGKELSI